MFETNDELSIVASEICGIIFSYTALPHEIKPKIDEFKKHMESPQDERHCMASLRFFGCLAERGLFKKIKGVPLPLVEIIGKSLGEHSDQDRPCE